jgi:hypothetical protein
LFIMLWITNLTNQFSSCEKYNIPISLEQKSIDWGRKNSALISFKASFMGEGLTKHWHLMVIVHEPHICEIGSYMISACTLALGTGRRYEHFFCSWLWLIDIYNAKKDQRTSEYSRLHKYSQISTEWVENKIPWPQHVI